MTGYMGREWEWREGEGEESKESKGGKGRELLFCINKGMRH